MVLLELFSGIGGFSKGLEAAGYTFDKVYFSEIDKHAIANFKYNFPYEAIFIQQRRAVRQELFIAVACFISGECRQSQREEKGLASVRKEFQVVAALCGELFNWYSHILVVILLVQVLPANHPAVCVLGVNAVCRPDMVGKIRVVVPMHPVRHACRDLQAFHARQVSLCVCLKPFDTDFIKFKIVDKKVPKRTAIQETVLDAVRSYNEVIEIAGKSTVRTVYALPKFTIPDDKLLLVELYEKSLSERNFR